MRPNFDTLYSFAIIDLSHPAENCTATLVLPSPATTDAPTAPDGGGERYHYNPPS